MAALLINTVAIVALTAGLGYVLLKAGFSVRAELLIAAIAVLSAGYSYTASEAWSDTLFAAITLWTLYGISRILGGSGTKFVTVMTAIGAVSGFYTRYTGALLIVLTLVALGTKLRKQQLPADTNNASRKWLIASSAALLAAPAALLLRNTLLTGYPMGARNTSIETAGTLWQATLTTLALWVEPNGTEVAAVVLPLMCIALAVFFAFAALHYVANLRATQSSPKKSDVRTVVVYGGFAVCYILLINVAAYSYAQDLPGLRLLFPALAPCVVAGAMLLKLFAGAAKRRVRALLTAIALLAVALSLTTTWTHAWNSSTGTAVTSATLAPPDPALTWLGHSKYKGLPLVSWDQNSAWVQTQHFVQQAPQRRVYESSDNTGPEETQRFVSFVNQHPKGVVLSTANSDDRAVSLKTLRSVVHLHKVYSIPKDTLYVVYPKH